MDDITLTWNGQEHVIPAERLMVAIAKIEDVITLTELFDHAQRGNAPMAKLSMAFGSVLRLSGAKVTDREVYNGMFSDGGGSVQVAVETLLAMMLPPESFRDDSQGEDAKKKGETS